MSEIERCPWCQSPASVKTSRDGEISTVSCDNGQCKAAGPREWSPEQAVVAWNSRSQSERVSRLEEALTWIEREYENQDLNHKDFRVEAYRRARSALNQGADDGQ